MKKPIAVGIIVLFIVSTVSPMVIGFEVDAVSEIAVEVKPEYDEGNHKENEDPGNGLQDEQENDQPDHRGCI